MKKITLALASAAAIAAISGSAVYAQTPVRADRAERGADVTRQQTEERALAAFERMDINTDGVLNAADREAFKAQRGERRAARLQARFDRLDGDKNGAISRAEFNAAHDQAREKFAARANDRTKDRAKDGRRGHHRGHRMAGGFGGFAGPGKFKASGDSSVTKAQFTAAALDRFDRMDTNKDGTVTAAERRDAFKTFREQRRSAQSANQS